MVRLRKNAVRSLVAVGIAGLTGCVHAPRPPKGPKGVKKPPKAAPAYGMEEEELMMLSQALPLPAPRKEVPSLSVSRFVLARNIEQREPVGEDESFEDGEPIVAFLQFRNEGMPDEVRIRWEKRSDRGNKRRRSATIRVGTSEHYRTWSRTASLTPGKYDCIVETLDGERISELSFEVKAFEENEADYYFDGHGA